MGVQHPRKKKIKKESFDWSTASCADRREIGVSRSSLGTSSVQAMFPCLPVPVPVKIFPPSTSLGWLPPTPRPPLQKRGSIHVRPLNGSVLKTEGVKERDGGRWWAACASRCSRISISWLLGDREGLAPLPLSLSVSPLCLPFLSTSNHEIVMHEAAQIAILQQQQAQAQQWHHNQQWYTTLMEWHPEPHWWGFESLIHTRELPRSVAV